MVKPKFYKVDGNPGLPNQKKAFFSKGGETFNDDFTWLEKKERESEEDFIREQLMMEESEREVEFQERYEQRAREEEERRMEDERMAEESRRQQEEQRNYPVWHDYDGDNTMDDFW